MIYPTIQSERLWRSLMEMAEIGQTSGGGVCRLALTDEDLAARELFVKWCEDARLTIRVDELGNIFARRAGSDLYAPPVMTGSHLDTQPLGGRFDGVYGVLAGLEVARTLNDAKIETTHPIDVVVWTNEEGSRFPAGCMGSAVFAGQRDLDVMLNLTDADGYSVKDELKRIGFDGPEKCGNVSIKALYEAHIEQGPILENASKTIGVVMSAQGLRCFWVHVSGIEGHAGTLPMDKRRDAFQGAARMAVAIDNLANTFVPHPVITIGVVNVGPGSRSTIPGTTSFMIDCRCPDEQGLNELEDEIKIICKGIAKTRGLEINIEMISKITPITFNKDCINSIRNAAEKRKLEHQDISSGAGHDACHVSFIAPVGMIFIPCEHGISHNETEYASPSDITAGAQVLFDVVVGAAKLE
jgi:N-carbamoyl-L-amino-acid hydrolase